MARRPQFRERFDNPELFLSELIKKGAQGIFHERDEYVPFLFRATVEAVDVVGGKLENATASGGVTHTIAGQKKKMSANLGPINPPNSVKARIITDGYDQFIDDSRLRVFWPFFPEHIALPIKPGEHIYVVFEDSEFEHGLWITKIPGHTGMNYVRGQEKFKAGGQRPLASMFSDTKDISSDKREFDTDEAAGEKQVKDRLTGLF